MERERCLMNSSMDRPYWRRAHHDWKFWFAMFMMFAAITMYVLSDDLAWVPRFR
jgi:formate hydrogenlyase subunit 3/multisubunit Na+/H+ antiporter MnhD subunit